MGEFGQRWWQGVGKKWEESEIGVDVEPTGHSGSILHTWNRQSPPPTRAHFFQSSYHSLKLPTLVIVHPPPPPPLPAMRAGDLVLRVHPWYPEARTGLGTRLVPKCL